MHDLGLHPDEVLNLTYREFLYLQKRKKEDKYFWSHNFYSVCSTIINTRPRGKKGQKPKMYKAEDFIGSFETYMNGGKEKEIETPDSIYKKMLMVFPDNSLLEGKK